MTDTPSFSGEIVWRPTPDYTERAHLTRFMRLHAIADYTELMARSTADVAWFTDAVLRYLDVRFRVPYTQVLDLSDSIEWPRWSPLTTGPRTLWRRRRGRAGRWRSG